jgi:hypothetical protein
MYLKEMGCVGMDWEMGTEWGRREIHIGYCGKPISKETTKKTKTYVGGQY